jgi:transcriptional regulator with XRE-family HTH domain
MFRNLRKIRLERKMTLKYVSEKLTIAESTLSKIETGQQGLLSDTAIQLANIYKVSLDELLGRDWHNPETTVYKTVDFEFNDVLRKLRTYSNNDLMKLSGAIDLVIEERIGAKDRLNTDSNNYKDITRNKL